MILWIYGWTNFSPCEFYTYSEVSNGQSMLCHFEDSYTLSFVRVICHTVSLICPLNLYLLLSGVLSSFCLMQFVLSAWSYASQIRASIFGFKSHSSSIAIFCMLYLQHPCEIMLACVPLTIYFISFHVRCTVLYLYNHPSRKSLTVLLSILLLL